MPHPVMHFEIAGKDGRQLQDFYAKLFDWDVKVQAEMGNYGLVEGGEGGIGGGIYQTPEDPRLAGAYLTIYVQVDDLQASLDKAEALGGKTLMPPTPIPGVGASALFRDPAGNMVGLFKGME